MAINDKDVNIKNVVMNEDSSAFDARKKEIPEAEDQSSNFPKEELFKQNIQMGDTDRLIDEDLSLQSESRTNQVDQTAKDSGPNLVEQGQAENNYANIADSDVVNLSNSVSSGGDSNYSNPSSVIKPASLQNSQASQVEKTNEDQAQSSNQAVFESPSHGSPDLGSGINAGQSESVDNQASAPELIVSNATGDEDSAIALDINAALTDTDGSESLVVEVQDIPNGAVLSDGVNSFTATSSETTADITGWNFDSLTITPAENSDADFDLAVQATSTEHSNNDVSTSNATLSVNVNSINDAPDSVSLDGNAVVENGSGIVIGTLSTSDVDAGDVHSYSVSDSRFEVIDGKLQLKAGISLDYEKEQAIELDITSTDSHGASFTQTFSIDVKDAVEQIVGTNNADYLKGGIGSDDIIALDGNDVVVAGDGNDRVDGGAGNDRLYGQAGDDNLIGGDGNDSLYGQAGDDQLSGGAGNDVLNGGAGENVLDGGDGADRLYGHQGGTDEIKGGAGDDYIYMDGNDRVDGGDGFDRVYTYGEEDVSIDMGEANVEQVIAYSDADHNIDASSADQGVYARGRGGDDEIKGSDHADRLFGGEGENVLDGGDGADRLYGHQGGTDEIKGGAGDDYIYMDGNDRVDGGDGFDRVYTYGEEDVSIDMGEANVEQVIAYSDADHNIDASSADQGVYARGRGGDDEIKGSDHADRLFGGEGENVLDGGDGADRLYGHQGGTDEIKGGAGDDYIYMDGNDRVDGGDGFDRVYTYGEEDVSIDMGEANVEQVIAYSDADHNIDASSADQGVYARGRGGDDEIKGSDHADRLFGGEGENVLDGGDGADRLYGHQGGTDEIKGGAGDDYIYMDGNDRVDGGDGFDRVYTYGEEDVSIDMGEANVEQVIAYSDADHNIDASSADQGVYARGRGGDDEIKGSDHADRLFGGEGENVLDGGDGADRLYGHQGGTDEIKGGAGDDYIYMDGNDRVDGGDGFDRVYTYGEEDVSIDMGEANVEQVIAYSDADHNIDASSADQGVYARGRGGDDEIKGSDHADRLFGGEGDDQLVGGGGNDRLYGQDDDDIFVVGDGSDVVYGGDGSDLFILDALDGNDTFHGGNGNGWSDIIDINVSPSDTGDSDNPWSIEVNGEQVQFDLADGGIDVGPDATGVISFADGSEVAFDGVEQIQW